jgi:rod shape-determining protein MreD
MYRHFIWLGGFIILLLQSTVFHWILPASWKSDLFISIHFSLVLVIYIGLFVNRYTALIYGITFGFILDVVSYGNILGIYTFGMAVIGYYSGIIKKYQPDLFYIHMSIVGLGLATFEIINYASNRFFRIIDTSVIFAFTNYMIPTILFNLFFAVICYTSFRKLVERLYRSSIRLED